MSDFNYSTTKLEPLSLHFSNINYTIKNKKDPTGKTKILHGISGHAPAGTLLAILGPSGAGKSRIIYHMDQSKTDKCHRQVHFWMY